MDARIHVLTTEPVRLTTNRYGAADELWKVTFTDGTTATVREKNDWVELNLEGEFRTQTLYDPKSLSPHVYAYQEECRHVV